MSFYLEEECPVTFDFDYAKLAEDVISFCIEHEGFPYEAEEIGRASCRERV